MAALKGAADAPKAHPRSRSPRQRFDDAPAEVPAALRALKALVINLSRRPDRWKRCDAMLKAETPWLQYERFPASDGREETIPEEEVCAIWNTKRNAVYGDYDEWVYDAPGTELDGMQWKWASDEPGPEDKEWRFEADDTGSATVEKLATKEKWALKKVFAKRFLEPGQVLRMSGGERGCAHSHRRVWEVAASRKTPTLVLEDDAQFRFKRSNPKLGLLNGRVLTERLRQALEEAPPDFDVLYLSWAGWRGGNFKIRQEQDFGKVIRKVEYVWTTVAYVISPAGAQRLLKQSCPINQPVDNFMAWEASQGTIKSFVVLDKGDTDDMWAGGIVDQVNFMGDSDVPKSDGGLQGDNFLDFAVAES
mmetsp:Transcript_118272/g.334254  ORF Transcript_118272/g.334254 Transcript_118272/m.334254 type:complete len:363 (+) Transcript_118272:93-1181(+)